MTIDQIRLNKQEFSYSSYKPKIKAQQNYHDINLQPNSDIEQVAQTPSKRQMHLIELQEHIKDLQQIEDNKQTYQSPQCPQKSQHQYKTQQQQHIKEQKQKLWLENIKLQVEIEQLKSQLVDIDLTRRETNPDQVQNLALHVQQQGQEISKLQEQIHEISQYTQQLRLKYKALKKKHGSINVKPNNQAGHQNMQQMDQHVGLISPINLSAYYEYDVHQNKDIQK